MENSNFKTPKYYSRDNPFLFWNIAVIIIALVIMWKFRKSKEFWYGVGALFLIGLRMYAGPVSPDTVEQDQ